MSIGKGNGYGMSIFVFFLAALKELLSVYFFVIFTLFHTYIAWEHCLSIVLTYLVSGYHAKTFDWNAKSCDW